MLTAEQAYRPDQAFIETYSGGKFYPSRPRFNVLDMAHALGMMCRYGGHCSDFYSVAEHSVLVSLMVDDLKWGDPMEALLHDGTEAYWCDIPAPFKQLLPDWRGVDTFLEAELRQQFKLNPVKSLGVKRADWYMLFIEAYWLLPDSGECFTDPENMRPAALELKDKYKPECFFPGQAKRVFLERFSTLYARRSML